MLILDFNLGDGCDEAVTLYEKAFNTEAWTSLKNRDTGRIELAVMNIHGQTVQLHDQNGNKDRLANTAVSVTINFDSVDELYSCYNVMKQDSITLYPLEKKPGSKLSVEFIDKFGVQWCFYDASLRKVKG